MTEVILNDDITQEVIDAVDQLEDKPEPEDQKVEKPKADQTFSQADVDRIVQQRLARDKADRDKDKADADKWREAEREKLPREQQLIDRIAELEKAEQEKAEQLEKIQLETLRERVAHEKGLTEKQAARLSGTTREELEADADDLLEAFPARKSPSQQPLDGLSGGGKPGDSAPTFKVDDVIKNVAPF